jgi:hypothetical protein
MKNQELMQAMQQTGRLTVVSVGDAPKSTAHSQDETGSPQITVRLKRKDGTENVVYVVPGIEGKTFRVVLDDRHMKIRKGESLRQAVRRVIKAQTERIWPKAEYPGYEIV